MGEKQTKPFQLSFNGLLKVDFQGSHVTSDGGLILVRELDERLGLGELIDEHLSDSRQGTNKQFTLADLLRQSVYSRLAGYEDLNDAERISIDPTFRLIGSQKIWDRGAALTSTLHGFETEMLASEENLLGLRALNRELVGQAEAFDDSERVVLDMDSTESPVHGQQEGSAYNGHFESVCYHPLLLFNGHGDCLAAKLRPGNVRSAEDWDELLLPEIERQQAAGKQVAFRGDAAFAKPEVYEASEERGVQYAIRIPANKSLELEIEDILFRPPGRPSRKPLVRYKSFRYQAESWSKARRIVAKVEHHQGELFPAGRIHRDEHELAKPLGGALLQQARHGGAVDQGRQTGHALDKAVVPSVPGERGTAATERAGLQPGQLVAAARTAEQDQELVADELATQVDEDRRSAGQARAVLLAAAGRRAFEPQAVRRHAAQHLGAAAAKRVALTGRGSTVFGSKRFRKEQCRPERRSARSINVCERMDEPWRLPAEVMCRVQREKTWYSGQRGGILSPCQGQNGNPGYMGFRDGLATAHDLPLRERIDGVDVVEPRARRGVALMRRVDPQVAGLAARVGLAPLADAHPTAAGLGVMDVVLTIGRGPPHVVDVGCRDRG